MTNQKLPLIDMTLCVKCLECIRKCPQKAIVTGSNENNPQCAKCIKYCLLMENISCRPENICIIHERCNSCGECMDACRYNAIQWIPDMRESTKK